MITFEIPKTQPGYSILDFAKHVLNYSPVYELRSDMRMGDKAIDAIELAVKENAESFSMSDEIGNHFKDAVEKTKAPKLYQVVDGKMGEQVPNTFYYKFYEAFETGKHSND